ncbi:MAG: folylpolyglutamate synthase/dihydrofolate synthase family protein [Rikenellaceae bacterium]
MRYEEALSKILSIPMFQSIGAAAFAPTLKGSIVLNKLFDNPYNSYPTIHVAGTNGKGSTSSMLTSILMEAGYRVGCYTSPHLADYRERVRINGVKVSEKVVCDFMEQLGDAIDVHKPSFFEVTTTLAFYAFEREKVDIAVIETGLGGLTDSTNIITPILSVITNIGFDHKNLLGNTLTEIATQKGGIIKVGVPAVIGEHGAESDPVFHTITENLTFAEDQFQVVSYLPENRKVTVSNGKCYDLDLAGEYQLKNLVTVLCAVEKLRKSGVVVIPEDALERGLSNVCRNSALEGRWQKIADKPLTVCDTGHNEDGIRYVTRQLGHSKYNKLYIVIGFMADKDVRHILPMFPTAAHYLFAPASNPRTMTAQQLSDLAGEFGLKGEICVSVSDGYKKAKTYAKEDDMIFIGGSTFIVADLLSSLPCGL